jgi:hypothetical protein
MYLASSYPRLKNCIISGNKVGTGGGSCPSCGGGMYLVSSNPILKSSVLSGNTAGAGGGMYLASSTPTIEASILSYNTGYNLYLASTTLTPSVSYSDLYAPDGKNTFNLTSQGYNNFYDEPGFQAYMNGSSPCTPGANYACLPADFHLSLTSPLIDVAWEATLFGLPDVGAYGGEHGDEFDLDNDGYPDYPWHGTFQDALQGYDPGDYDPNDQDPAVPGG